MQSGLPLQAIVLCSLAGLLWAVPPPENNSQVASPPATNGRVRLPSSPAPVTKNSSEPRTGMSAATEKLHPEHRPMTQRALSVLVVVSAAVIIFFVIRTIRIRKRAKKPKRYGVLNTNIDNMELTPLEQDDDDDDTTLFDANHLRS